MLAKETIHSRGTSCYRGLQHKQWYKLSPFMLANIKTIKVLKIYIIFSLCTKLQKYMKSSYILVLKMLNKDIKLFIF